MIVTPITTPIVAPGDSLTAILDRALPTLPPRSIVVVTSKIVALCENQTVPLDGTDRWELICAQSELYHHTTNDQPYHFTIAQNTLIPAAGIDVSNGNGKYILWPRNAVASANTLRRHLAERANQGAVGVIITDSTIGLSRWGTLGIAIGHSGFEAVRDYLGETDLFGRPLLLSQSNLAGGLAAAAVAVMGEGAECTPLALIEDLPFITFNNRDTTAENIKHYYVSPLEDRPFMPFFTSQTWHRGGLYRSSSTP